MTADMTKGADRFVTSPRPREVPAFGVAQAAGLTPRVPPTPPPVSVEPTAHRALRDVALTVAVLIAAVLAVLLIGGGDGRLSWSALLALLAVTCLGFAVAGAPMDQRLGPMEVGCHLGAPTRRHRGLLPLG
jgi:hypothetical protein